MFNLFDSWFKKKKKWELHMNHPSRTTFCWNIFFFLFILLTLMISLKGYISKWHVWQSDTYSAVGTKFKILILGGQIDNRSFPSAVDIWVALLQTGSAGVYFWGTDWQTSGKLFSEQKKNHFYGLDLPQSDQSSNLCDSKAPLTYWLICYLQSCGM